MLLGYIKRISASLAGEHEHAKLLQQPMYTYHSITLVHKQ